MRKLIFITTALLLALGTGAQRTTRRHAKRAPTAFVAPEKPLRRDTATGDRARGVLRFTSYEKQLRATRESFFVTCADSAAAAPAEAAIEIHYRDTQGRGIHSRRVSLSPLPQPGQTLRVNIASWDPQRSFYSPPEARPRLGGGTPYSVTIRVDTLFYILPQ